MSPIFRAFLIVAAVLALQLAIAILVGKWIKRTSRADEEDQAEADQIVGDVPNYPQGWRGGQRHGDRLRRLSRSRANNYREAVKPEVDRLKMIGVMEDFNAAPKPGEVP